MKKALFLLPLVVLLLTGCQQEEADTMTAAPGVATPAPNEIPTPNKVPASGRISAQGAVPSNQPGMPVQPPSGLTLGGNQNQIGGGKKSSAPIFTRPSAKSMQGAQ
jgi:hypothetical protein